MQSSTHLIFGTILALILFILFPQIQMIGFLIIILASVLIDIDHYIYYVYKKRNLSLHRAYRWFIQKKRKLQPLTKKQRTEFYTGFSFLHGIEILLITFILGVYISEYFYYVLIGFTFHILLDYIHQITWHNRLDKISLIYDFFKFKKLRYV